MSKKYLFFLFIFLPVLVALLFIWIIIKSNPKKTIMPKTMQAPEIIRKPAVAGRFYPADKNQLEEQIEDYLNKTEKLENKGKLKILIVPHAGLDYSGQTAAWGFKQLENQNIKKVIILGASHRAWFDNISVFNKGFWETPLGITPIDSSTADNLLSDNNIVGNFDNFNEEHSLEMELIFLQKVLKDFKIIPILLGQISDYKLQILAEKIFNNMDDETLLVISSDLSHYPDKKTAGIVDNQTINSIISGNPNEFIKTINLFSSQNIPNLQTPACADKAILIAMLIANKLNFREIKKIYYENSGDITADISRVVGYGAIGFWDQNTESKTNILDIDGQKDAIMIARKTLEEYLDSGNILTINPNNKILLEKLGAFVTLKNNDRLRGCIGLFEPKIALYQVIQEMAIAAATQDSRFPPVTIEELPNINIEISIMTPKEKINDYKKIVLGKHGVVIKNKIRSGTFLPQVATETGWNLEEFLSHLCTDKAGLLENCYLQKETEIYTFEVQIIKE